MAEQFAKDIDYDSCVAYYRDALAPRHARRVRQYLDAHPDEARRAHTDAAHEQAIAQSQAGVLQEPIPARLRPETWRRVNKPWPGRLALAATIVVSLAIGWWLGGLPPATKPGSHFTERVVSAARQPVTQKLAHAVAHAPIKVQPPDLALQGYRLVGQQRLTNTAPALIEFVYRNASGQQVRIYAEPGHHNRPAPAITSHDGLYLTQWREGGTRYALVGNVSKPTLQKLAGAARNDLVNGDNMLAGTEQRLPHKVSAGNPGDHAQQLPLPTASDAPQAVNETKTIQPVRM